MRQHLDQVQPTIVVAIRLRCAQEILPQAILSALAKHQAHDIPPRRAAPKPISRIRLFTQYDRIPYGPIAARARPGSANQSEPSARRPARLTISHTSPMTSVTHHLSLFILHPLKITWGRELGRPENGRPYEPLSLSPVARGFLDHLTFYGRRTIVTSSRQCDQGRIGQVADSGSAGATFVCACSEQPEG
jgi:hypothetical protein